MKPLPHQLAAEVDRCMKLNLSNYEFELLARLIARQEDGRKFANELMTQQSVDIVSMLKSERLGE